MPARPPTPVPDYLHQWFDELNVKHFEGLLERPTFIIGSRLNNMFAWYAHVPGVATLLTLTTECLARGAPFAKDSLLHEMVHHAVATLDGITPPQMVPDIQRHGEEFVRRANAIADRL